MNDLLVYNNHPKKQNATTRLVHLLDQVVDELLSVTGVTTLDEVRELSLSETTVRVGQLEWPQEVVDLLEVRTNSGNLVDQVLNGDDTELTQSSLDDSVVGQGDSLGVDLTETSLVHQLSDGGQVGVTVSNVRLGQLEQLGGSLGHSDEDTGVDLGQSQQLHDLSWLWWNLHDTLDSDDENQLLLSLNVVVVVGLGVTLGLDDSTLSIGVLLVVSGGSLQDSLSLLLRKLMLVKSFKLPGVCLLSPERWLTEQQHRMASHFEFVISSSKPHPGFKWGYIRSF